MRNDEKVFQNSFSLNKSDIRQFFRDICLRKYTAEMRRRMDFHHTYPLQFQHSSYQKELTNTTHHTSEQKTPGMISTNSTSVTSTQSNAMSSSTLPMATIDAALLNANLATTKQNRALVEFMLLNQLPINKESLNKFYRMTLQHKDASPETLLLLSKHNLPVTKEHIAMYEAYQNGEHALLTPLNSLSEELAEQISHLLEETLISSNNQETATLPSTSTMIPVEEGKLTQDATIQNLSAQSTWTKETLSTIKELLTFLFPEETFIANEPTSSQTTQASSPDFLGNLPFAEASLNALSATDELGQTVVTSQNAFENPNVTDNTSDTIFSKDQTVFSEESQQTSVLKGNSSPVISDTDLVSFTLKILQTASGFSNPSVLMDHNQLKDLLLSTLRKQFTLTPEEIFQNKATEKIERLRDKLTELETFSAKNLPEETHQKLTSYTSALKQNLNFMSALNQEFCYIQLPVQMKEKTANGELYVYSRKRTSLREDGSIRALLRLDMENIGPTDIYLTLTNTQVNATISMSDTDSISILSEHLPELETTLQKKGYTLSSTVKTTEEPFSFTEDFIEQNDTRLKSNSYGFDTKA